MLLPQFMNTNRHPHNRYRGSRDVHPTTVGKLSRMRVLGWLRRLQYATSGELAKHVGLSRHGTLHHLRQLRAEGKVLLVQRHSKYVWICSVRGLKPAPGAA